MHSPKSDLTVIPFQPAQARKKLVLTVWMRRQVCTRLICEVAYGGL